MVDYMNIRMCLNYIFSGTLEQCWVFILKSTINSFNCLDLIIRCLCWYFNEMNDIVVYMDLGSRELFSL